MIWSGETISSSGRGAFEDAAESAAQPAAANFPSHPIILEVVMHIYAPLCAVCISTFVSSQGQHESLVS